MSILKPSLTVLCTAGLLSAQSSIDLNSLASAAAQYGNHGLQGVHTPPATLDLHLLRGDNGGNPALLMTKAGDVARWSIFYNTQYKLPVPEGIVLPKSASLKCVKGVFSDFALATPAIPVNCHGEPFGLYW